MSNTAMIFSHTGQFHVVDIANPAAVTLHHATTASFLTAVDIAPSGDAIAVTDTDGIVHLWGSPDKIRFSDIPAPIEFPDIVQPPLPHIDVNSDEPLNSVGMPFYKEPLLSSWPSHMVFSLNKTPQKIDPDILATIKPGGFGYVPFPKRTRRYQVDATGDKDAQDILAPKFLSEKKKHEQSKSSDFEDYVAEDRNKRRLFDIPRMYKKLEIKYSKFGVEDFDFQYVVSISELTSPSC